MIKTFDINLAPILMKWLEEHGHPPIAIDELPKLGYAVCSDIGIPLAMGFLRLAEGNMAIVDSLATNPNIKPREASEAVDKLFEKLIQVSSDLRIKYLMGMTVRNSLVKRTIKAHGFVLSPAKVLVRVV